MVIGRGEGNDSSTDSFNRPTGLVFAPNGNFFVSDGYVNHRVVVLDAGAATAANTIRFDTAECAMGRSAAGATR